MSTDGTYGALVALDAERGTVALSLEASLYPLPAILSACDVLLDRCWLVVERPDAARYRVVLEPKAGAKGEGALRAVAGELSNELLSCAFRHRVTLRNRAAIEAITTQAICGAMGPATLDELADFDFSEEPLDDPLGIAQPWEEKHAVAGDGEEPAGGSSSTSGEGS